MKTSPVSFKSIMVFTIDDGKPKASVPALVKAAFNNNYELKKYQLRDDIYVHNEVKDGSVNNASTNMAKTLDNIHKSKLPKGSKKVIMSKTKFSIGQNTDEKYYLTAATDDDEEKILRTLSKSNTLYAAKFGFKKV